MTANNDTVLQANFKSPAGSLINVYATSGPEFWELLDAMPEYLSKIASVEAALGAASTVAATVPVAPPNQQGLTAVPPVATPAGGEPLCEHGLPMKLVPAGISKATGKPYKAFYACGQARGMQCDTRITAA